MAILIKRSAIVLIGLLLLSCAVFADTLILDGDYGATNSTVKVYKNFRQTAQTFKMPGGGVCFDTVRWYVTTRNGAPAGTWNVSIHTFDGAGWANAVTVAVDAWNTTTGTFTVGWYNATLKARLCEGVDLTGGTTYGVLWNVTDGGDAGGNDWSAGHYDGNPHPSGNLQWGTPNALTSNDTTTDQAFQLWDVGGAPPVANDNSVSFAASNPSDGLATLIATRNYTFVPVMNNTVNISSCSLYSNTSNATSPMASISNPANNTESGFVITLPSAHTHNYQVICLNNDTSETDTGNRTYSYSDFAFSSESHNVTDYETLTSPFSYVFDVGEGVDNVTVAYLNVNGTFLSLASTGGTNVTVSGTRIPGLELTNNTQYQHNYTFLYVFVNGSSHNVTSPANYYQNIWWGFWLNFTASPINVLEGDTITANSTVTNVSDLAAMVVQQFYNGSSDTPSYSAGGYVSTFIAPSIGASYYPSDVESNLTLTYGATTLNRTSPQSENVTVWKVTLVDCGGAFTTVTLNFTFWDEEVINQPLYANMESSFWGFPNATLNHTYSMNCTNQTYCEICITPSWADFTVDSWQAYVSPAAYYGAGSYPQRAYFLEDAKLSNVTSNISLFLENTTLAKLVAISVDDEGGQSVKQAILYFARYYLNEDVYRTIAMVRTDDFGAGNTYLRPNDIWYRITVVQDGEVVGLFTPQTISCDPSASYCPLSLSLAPSTYLEYLEYIDKIAFACGYSDATNYTTCSYTDTSGLMQYARLRVWQQGTFYNTLVCDVNATTASGTLACFLGATPSGIYTYSFVAHFQDETTLDGGTIEITPRSALFGRDGLIYTALIVMLTFFLGIFNPAVAIGLAGVGVFMSWAIGLFSVPWSALVAFAVVVVALIAAMIRRGG